MKKVLSFTLALAMSATLVGTLAACNTDGGETNDAEIAKSAIDVLREAYGDKEKETISDYSILGQVRISTTNYDVSWTVLADASVNIQDYVSLGEMNATSKQIPVSITRGEVDVDYTLKAEVKVGKATETISFDRTVPAAPAAHDGTLENPYTVANVFDIASKMTPAAVPADDAVAVYVKGYIVDCGTEYSSARISNVSIVDEYSDDKTYQSPDALKIFSITYDSTNLTKKEDLTKGAEIIVKGYILNYQKAGAVTNEYEITYKGSDNVTCAYLEKRELTADEKAEAALNALNIPAQVTGNINLTSSVAGVTLEMTSKNSAISNDGKVTRPEAGEPDVSGEITITATIAGATQTHTKTFNVTVKAQVATVAGETALALTSTHINILNDNADSTYDKYNGDHTVGNYVVTTKDVMSNTYGDNDAYNVIQFKKESSTMTVSGEFTKIRMVVASSYSYAATWFNITAGDTVLPVTLIDTETTDKTTNTKYTISLYTIEFTVTGSGNQTITISNTNTFANYCISIDFYG